MIVKHSVNSSSPRLLDQTGYTLIELITVLSITGFLILAAGIGLSVFFSKFNEITKWEELQKSSFECIEQIRSGVKAPDDNLFGLANASNIEFIGGGYNPTEARGIRAFHGGVGTHFNDKVEFEYDGKSIRYRIVYGPSSSTSRAYLFPTKKQLEYITIEKFSFSRVAHWENESVSYTLIGVNLEAKVRVAKNKYRYIKYNTNIVNKPL